MKKEVKKVSLFVSYGHSNWLNKPFFGYPLNVKTMWFYIGKNSYYECVEGFFWKKWSSLKPLAIWKCLKNICCICKPHMESKHLIIIWTN